MQQSKNMKTSVILIHGGETFENYNAYIMHLKNCTFDPKKAETQSKRWNRNLQNSLGDDFNVIQPIMPSKNNAKYKEWKIWFEKIFPHIQEGSVLIGHSLGGTFLIKYLSEHDFPYVITATHIVAAPYDDKGADYSLADFTLPNTLRKFTTQAGKIFLYHSKDDPVVSFTNFEKYTQILPDAEKVIFKDKGHFMQEKFPELVMNIKKEIKK